MITRRDMLLASGGIMIAGGTFTSSTAVADEAKELFFHSTTPNNAEPKLDDLVKSWITPTKHFYVRSHAPNPVIDPKDFQLKVEGMVNRPSSLSLKSLERFKTRSTTATLTCATRNVHCSGAVGGSFPVDLGCRGRCRASPVLDVGRQTLECHGVFIAISNSTQGNRLRLLGWTARIRTDRARHFSNVLWHPRS